MSNERNPFMLYLDNHPEAGIDGVKRLFRILAKRTHPDTGIRDTSAFVELQHSYHAAIAAIIDSSGGDARGDGAASGSGVWVPATARERVLHLLYRYKAHLPSLSLTTTPLPPACMNVFAAALVAADEYGSQYLQTLERFDDQFHHHRAEIARYPDILTKYLCFLQGFSSFFDFIVTPNDFNDRVARSYFSEIHPVTDYDPTTSPALRSNRSAPARAVLYRFTVWLIEEMERGPCRIV